MTTLDRRNFMVATGCALLVPSWGHGYVPPSHAVLKRAQRALDERARLQVALLGRAWTEPHTPPVEIGERWLFGPVSQVDISGAAGQQAQWRSNAQPTGSVELLPPPAVRYVLSRLFGGGDLRQLLGGLGILPDPRSLRRIDGRIAIAIGAAHDQQRTPQIWFDQDTFLPLKATFRSDRFTYDLQLSKWNVPTTRSAFPGQIQIRQDGRPLRELKVTTLVRPRGAP